MTENRKKKAAIIESFGKMTNQQSLILINNKGLSANDMTTLRYNARANKVKITVVKNKLAFLALKAQNVNKEFLNLLQNINFFMICNDSVDGLGILSKLPPKKFTTMGCYEAGQCINDKMIINEMMMFNGFKAVAGNMIAKLQEPLTQLQKLFEVAGEKTLI